MPSSLYQNAIGTLSADERESLTEFEQWLEGVSQDIHGQPLDGRQLVENLRNEAHLTGVRHFGDFGELATFLRRCVSGVQKPVTDADWRDQYSRACQAHEGCGTGIPRGHLPGTLLRYCTSHNALIQMVERILGKTARIDLRNKTMSLEDAFHRLSLHWDSSRMTVQERLSGGVMAWATFEHDTPAPRDDPRAMVEALALPPVLGQEVILFEFSYPTDSVGNHRIPTIADAGWFHQFRPAPEVQLDPANHTTYWGWTGGRPPQPEIVHNTESLRVLQGPPRFLGRITRV